MFITHDGLNEDVLVRVIDIDDMKSGYRDSMHTSDYYYKLADLFTKIEDITGTKIHYRQTEGRSEIMFLALPTVPIHMCGIEEDKFYEMVETMSNDKIFMKDLKNKSRRYVKKYGGVRV